MHNANHKKTKQKPKPGSSNILLPTYQYITKLYSRQQQFLPNYIDLHSRLEQITSVMAYSVTALKTAGLKWTKRFICCMHHTSSSCNVFCLSHSTDPANRCDAIIQVTLTDYRHRGPKRKCRFLCRYVTPPGECYYNTLLCCHQFSSSSVLSCAFSAPIVYSKFGHHPHPLGYLCAKFRFFRSLDC